MGSRARHADRDTTDPVGFAPVPGGGVPRPRRPDHSGGWAGDDRVWLEPEAAAPAPRRGRRRLRPDTGRDPHEAHHRAVGGYDPLGPGWDEGDQHLGFADRWEGTSTRRSGAVAGDLFAPGAPRNAPGSVRADARAWTGDHEPAGDLPRHPGRDAGALRPGRPPRVAGAPAGSRPRRGGPPVPDDTAGWAEDDRPGNERPEDAWAEDDRWAGDDRHRDDRRRGRRRHDEPRWADEPGRDDGPRDDGARDDGAWDDEAWDDGPGRHDEPGRVRTLDRRTAPPAADQQVEPQAAGPSIRVVLVAVVVGSLVAVALGVWARQHEPTGVAVNLAGFSSGVAVKAWLGSLALLLALVQGVTGRWVLRGSPWTGFVHRWSGRAAVLVTVPVAVQCLYAFGWSGATTSALLHSVLGCAFYGAFVTKMLLLRRPGVPGWVLAVAGGLLLAVLAGIWLTSALWFFTDNGLTF